MKIFSAAWISVSAKNKLSNASNQARSDHHKLSISLLHAEAKVQKKPLPAYVSIAKSLLDMDKLFEEKTEQKYNICYVLAKQ